MAKLNSPWGQAERDIWLSEQVIKRSYQQEVVNKVDELREKFDVEQYGALSYAPDKYPVFMIKTKGWDNNKKTVLVTGGVHGYETSGVQGALEFLKHKANDYAQHFNILVAPCLSPWGYETINRWNPHAVDPNRSFTENSPAEESKLIMQKVTELGIDIFAHFDLHETTDTDNTVFRPALASRDNIKQDKWHIPDGFYTVGDTANPRHDFQTAIIDSVKAVTHIAPADENGNIIGETMTQPGVINYEVKKLGLCAGFSNSEYCTTTEVYPDSPRVTDQDCINAQVAAVSGGLDYLLKVVD